jgi:hypothetical protein
VVFFPSKLWENERRRFSGQFRGVLLGGFLRATLS